MNESVRGKSMRRRIAVVAVMFVASGLAFAFAAHEMRPALAQSGAQDREFDVLIRNGHIIDGTGSPWYAGDIGIRDGHIVAIGDLAHGQAKETIDAAGRVVAPGFIDMLGQSEIT